jgi:endonuclease/exonuclease/phosphatase family metal-dependent hydrolase
MKRLRVVTYNIHKCRGMDTRMKPERIAEVLSHLDADVIALQEVVRGHGEADQLTRIQRGLNGYESSCFGETRKIGPAGYGNAVLSRLPITGHKHYDITASWREVRGVVRADLELPDERCLHVFNVHLGTGYLERRKQGKMLVGDGLLANRRYQGKRLVIGDFNEWTRGLSTKLLSTHLLAVDVTKYLKRRRSYPGFFPMLHLDHIYYDPMVELTDFRVYRTKLSLIASDHLPLVADFKVLPARQESA